MPYIYYKPFLEWNLDLNHLTPTKIISSSPLRPMFGQIWVLGPIYVSSLNLIYFYKLKVLNYF